MNVSRDPAPPAPVVTVEEPKILPPFPGSVTRDAPAPLEGWWRQRLPFQHPIPYDNLTVRKSLRLYDAMMLDETIAYAQKLKITARLASGWSIQAPTDEDGDALPGSEEVRDHVQEQIEKWDRFDEFLAQMLDVGTKYGYVLGEIQTKDGKIGGKTSWVIDDVAVRNSRFFAFDVDYSGRLLSDGILEFLDPNPDGGGMVETWGPQQTGRHSPEKFVRWTYASQDSNAYGLYGRSDFHAAYRAYFLGDNFLKGLGETLDTYKHPIAIAVTKPGLTDTQRTDMLNAMVQGLKRKALVIPGEYLPEGVDYEKAVRFHEVTGKAGDFIESLRYLDTAKMRALLVGQLVAETGGDGKGSYALGKQHVSIFLRIMSWIGKSLSVALQSGLFKKIVRWNLGPDAVDLAPTLVWHAAGDAEALERAQIVQALLEAGAIDAREPWIRDYVGQFPKMDEDIAAQRAEENAKRLEAETRPPPAGGGPPKGKAGALAAAEEPLAGEADETPPRALFHEERKLDETGIAPFLDDLIERADSALYDLWGRVFDGPGGVMAWGRVALRVNGTPDLRISTSAIAEAADRQSNEAMVLGMVDAWMDVDMREREAGYGGLDAESLGSKPVFQFDLGTWAKKRGVPLHRNVAAAAARIRVDGARLDRLAEAHRKVIEQKMRDEGKRLVAEAKASVARARSKKGRAAREADLKALRKRWRGIDRDLGGQQTALAETVLNKAYSDARLELYETLPAGMVIGLLYSAIRDSHTTEFCLAWDGYRTPLNNPVVKRVTPPNHYRCRSKWVAILRGEATPGAIAAAAKRQPRVAKPGGGFP